MISATDSFVKYLANSFGDNPPVHWLRKTAEDPSAHLFQLNTLNVSILTFTEDGSEEEALISLDILADDERQAWGWAKIVRDKLIEQQYTPELDYEANPASPVSLGRLVSWDGREVSFQNVRTDKRTVHLNATFVICHVRQ